jgi:LCP family protein required for cell wall assembly
MQNASRKKPSNIANVLIVLLFSVLCLAAIVAVLVFRGALARHLTLSQLIAAPTDVASTSVISPAVAPSSTTPALPLPTAASSGSCGTGTIIMLFSGTGMANGMTSADSIRLLKIDFTKSHVTSIAFPRDLWVKTKGLESLGMAEYRLGPAFHYKQNATQGTFKEKILAGTTTVAQALYDNFAVAPQFYMTVNLEPWSKMVDTVGGVDINLAEPFTMVDGTVVPAGSQRLNGNMARDYIRLLSSGGEASRIQRQNQFVKAVESQDMVLRVIPKLPDLLKQFNDVIVTDLSPEQLLDLSCQAGKISPNQMDFYEVGGDMVTVRSDGALIPNIDKIKAFVIDALSK